jgi:uncharacterized protein YdiU (UPF0061 family)
VFSSIDRDGRYAYGNQPQIGLWDLVRLAETLLPLLAEEADEAIVIAEEALAAFQPRFAATHGDGMLRKLGIATTRDGDAEMGNAILSALQANRVDFTLFFRRLAGAIEAGEGEEGVRELFVDPTAADRVLETWRARLAVDGMPVEERRGMMNAVNPAYIPRNHRIEGVIAAAVDHEDFGPFDELREVLSRPFDPLPAFTRYEAPPLESELVRATFCGT